jgi:UDP-N-acetylglucosamine--N-acetylmuramyl-(pentapeptide) pyrophosphoryl-undecaprenol N-acetylglucosamine transferase
VIPQIGYDLELLDVPMLKGGGAMGWARGLSRLPASGWGAMGAFKRLNPGLVVSVGGYAAGPFTMLSSLRGVPSALMEQNSTPGMTNRLLGKVVDRAFVSFEQTCQHFPDTPCEFVGNPVRRSLLDLAESFDYQAPTERREFRILIIGGSGGAASFNSKLPVDLCALGAQAEHVVVRHQCGRDRLGEVDGGYADFEGSAEVVEFIDDMAEAYKWCDLLICRAGASTIAEVLVLGLPAIYVPFPHAADDHQTKNAQSIAEAGAGIAISDADIGQGRATRLLAGLLHNPVSLKNLAVKARTLGRPDAARVIATQCLEMLQG